MHTTHSWIQSDRKGQNFTVHINKCPFGTTYLAQIEIFFAESVEKRLKNKLNNIVGILSKSKVEPMNSSKNKLKVETS